MSAGGSSDSAAGGAGVAGSAFGATAGSALSEGAPAASGSAGAAGMAGVAGGGVGEGGGTAGGAAGVGGSSAAGAAGGSDRCDVANYAAATPPQLLSLTGNLGTHDPMILSADGKFFLFSTGDNLGAKTSNDLSSWQAAPDVLSSANQAGVVGRAAVPGVGNLWAPDASYFGDAYHLYYAASTFGSNRSCIGHLSRASMSAGSWADRGPVICSNTSTDDDYNAIDPNVIVDSDGTPWLTFGSFWSGIQLIKLDQSGDRDGTSLVALAARPSAGGALEAPFLLRRCGFYYLFTSWDKCCKGVDSTYNIRVGRAPALSGPFVDHEGKALLQGGGTLVVEGGSRYHGPGHNAVLFTATGAYNIYHAYDGNQNGASVLRIAELAWDAAGWPVSAGP